MWTNEAGGLTFRAGDRFVKWTPVGNGIDLAAEAVRLRWAVDYTPVPRVLDSGEDDEGTWLVTSPLRGRNAIARRWLANPAAAVAAIGAGLRAFHDALPVAACPFPWSAEDRIVSVERRLGAAEAASVTAPPPIGRLVACHGDTCPPNTILTDDGQLSGHVDLGQLGIADRWADLAVATWSATWNYGPGWEDALLDAYGIAPDPAAPSTTAACGTSADPTRHRTGLHKRHKVRVCAGQFPKISGRPGLACRTARRRRRR